MMIDIEKLCLPINAQSPCGDDPRQDTTVNALYYEIKDARYQARDIERKLQLGMIDLNPKSYWDKVFTMSIDLITNFSKDIEVAVWLLESLIRRENISGLKQGFELVLYLIQNYWETLHPQIIEDDIEARLAPLVGLNGIESEGMLIYPIQWLPVISDKCTHQITFWQYKKCLKNDKLANSSVEKKSQQSDEINLDTIYELAKEASPGFYSQLTQDVDECLRHYKEIIAFLDEKCGQHSPPSSDIINALMDYREHIGFLVNESGIINEVIKQDDHNENVTLNENEVVSKNAEQYVKAKKKMDYTKLKKIDNRQQALQTLQQIADFFKNSEPHSPVSTLIERAVKWGQMPLSELLNEMISDKQARSEVCNLIGINQNEE